MFKTYFYLYNSISLYYNSINYTSKKPLYEDTIMKNTLLGLLLTLTFASADVVAKPTPVKPHIQPIVKPITKPNLKPRYNRLGTDDYNYNPLYNDTEIEQEKKLAEKKEKIEALEKELNAKKEVEYKALQKKNKAQYDKAMKEADNRKSKIKTENSIIISDEPIK